MENTKNAKKSVLPTSFMRKKSAQLGLIAGFGVIIIALILILGSNSKFSGKVQATSKPSGISLSFWMIPFKNVTVALERNNKGITSNTFWRLPITKTTTNNETVETITTKVVKASYADNLVYNTGKDQLLFIQPSSYQQLRIVSKAEFKDLSTAKNAEFKLTADSDGLNSDWKAIRKDVKDPANKSANNYTVVCYVPIQGTDSYLEFDEPQHSAGTNVNMCEYITNMGIRAAAKQ